MKENLTLFEMGRHVFALRRKHGIRQAALARKCGISVHTLSDIENGKTDFRISIIAKIADALGAKIILLPNG